VQRDSSRLRERLLLSLHGLGTNTGLKRLAGGQPGITYKDLLNGNDFILYRRGGEIATNRVEDQEITMLA
jgi:hypothetical protein